MTDVEPDLRIVGGVSANPYSWPSQVMLVQTISGNYVFQKNGKIIKKRINEQYLCGGTLINSQTILTAGHCAGDTFLTEIDGENQEVSIQYNRKYPNLESTYTIYLGVYDVIFMKLGQNVPSPGIQVSVQKVIRV